MTQNKSVEEVVEEIFDTEYMTGHQPNLNKEYITSVIRNERQTSQEREREIVEALIKEFQDYKHQSENEYVHIDTVVHAIASAHNITLTNPNKD